MVTVTNQAEFEAAVTAEEVEITISGTVNTLTVPVHVCRLVIPAGSSVIGAIISACTAGTAETYYNGAEPVDPS